MGFLEKVTGITFKKKGAAPGKAIIIQTVAAGDQERNAEMYHPPGESSAPTKNDRVISIPVGTGTRVIIASHNYRIEVDVDAGEKTIYSTNTDGDTVKAKIHLDITGKITFENETQNLATLFSSLIDTVKGIITTGSPSTQVVSAASKALLDVEKTKILQLLKE